MVATKVSMPLINAAKLSGIITALALRPKRSAIERRQAAVTASASSDVHQSGSGVCARRALRRR